ncbi:MAG: hypothetical protein AAGD14_12500 [Planctomycetota bacterium]
MREFLSRQARSEAGGRAALWAGRIALVGVTATAVTLFLDRAGFDVPWFQLPDSGATPLQRLFGWFAISTAGLAQTALVVGVVLAVAFFLRVLMVPLLRRRPAVIALALDRRMQTERFSAALEADGPFRPLVERAALAQMPPDGFLRPHRGRKRVRFLLTLALALVFVIAVMPGVAPGAPGDAPVLGTPDPGQKDNLLELILTGPTRPLKPGEPIELGLQARTSRPPTRDLELPVYFVLDDEIRIPAERALFFPAGVQGEDDLIFDLARNLPPLEAGEHTVYAMAGGGRSNVWKFTIEGDGGGGGQDEQEEEQQQEPEGGQEQPKAMPEARPRYVEPLVREGEKVEKKARVPIEVPGGGAPREASIDEAWPELERRREAALNREGLSPSARELVRKYFDSLRPAEETAGEAGK